MFNKTQWKVKISAFIMLIVLAFYAPLAYAQTESSAETTEVLQQAALQQEALTENSVVSETPSELGADPEGYIATTDTEIQVETDTDTSITDSTDFDLNTGRNEIGNSTVVSGLETGNIDATVNLLNISNSELGEGSSFGSQNIIGGEGNITLFSPDENRVDISSNNYLGGGSTDLLSNNNVVHVFEQSDTGIDNSIEIDANTGENLIQNNTKIDEISTGYINLGVNLINLMDIYAPDLELTVDVWNILGDFSGDIAIADTPENNSESSVNNLINVNCEQNINLDNYFGLEMNTGENDLGSNTMIGDVVAGTTNVMTNLANISDIATPMYFLLNVFGDWDGNYGGLDPDYTIVNIIPDDAEISVNDSLDYNSITNTDIGNRIGINANTGRNQINRNTIVGSISTGNINVAQNVVNIWNNIDRRLGRVRIGIINIFGSWKHKAQGGGGDNPPIEPPEEILPESEEPLAVLGKTRIIPEMNILPAAGADIDEGISVDHESHISIGFPNRGPIWGLPALLSLYLLLLGFMKKSKQL